jgi:hypothetical protein
MVDADLMVAPVLDPDRRQAELYLPAGSGVWLDLWTEVPREPGRHVVDAPLGRPVVMYRSGSAAGPEIRDCLREHGLLQASGKRNRDASWPARAPCRRSRIARQRLVEVCYSPASETQA